MNDQEAWQRGVRFMEKIHGRLPRHARRQLGELLDSYRRHKGDMLTLTAGSDAVCRDCGGQCCLNGKYRFNGLDLLALFDQQAPLPVPDFAQKPLCPYGDACGCGMEPPFRPLDCVLFICGAIEELLSETAANALALLEQELRRCVQQAETLLEQPLGRPLLLMAEHTGDTSCRTATITNHEDTPWPPPTTLS
ncbi:MAG: hypothetical protein P4L44_04275 [Oryzomonas sp.]|uniref:hypothetical protein n=1 Tax=Oryzomonas sp. TaxID=2855186 RepID=UPI00284571AA|nr:hypothetical protein [Oryzomonas sp.]MDR3579165.1 hypothetical protein [Oryzomonas sp.]